MSEEEISIGSKAEAEVNCSGCQKSILMSTAYAVNQEEGLDKYFCPDCKEKLSQELQAETINPNMVGAVGLGVLAGVVASVIWFFVEILTGYQIGYLALGAGYLIGWGVVLGSGKKKGTKLQLLSAGLTLAAVYLASYFSQIYYLNKEVGGTNTIWISPFNPDMIGALISPMGLLIWGIALYIAFKVPQAPKI